MGEGTFTSVCWPLMSLYKNTQLLYYGPFAASSYMFLFLLSSDEIEVWSSGGSRYCNSVKRRVTRVRPGSLLMVTANASHTDMRVLGKVLGKQRRLIRK